MTVNYQDQRNDAESWEIFWQHVLSDPTALVVWGRSNFDSVESMAPYLDKLINSFGRDLPLVDLGCGDGGFTEHLTDYFDVVVGVDISEAAIAKALQDNQGSKASYERLNATDTGSAQQLHARIGDANVHVRGVLQAMMPADWPHALASLEILTGQQGKVFDMELSTKYTRLLEDMGNFDKQRAGSLLRPGGGLAPNDFTTTGLVDLYESRGWNVQSVDELDLHSRISLPDGSILSFPTICMIADKSA